MTEQELADIIATFLDDRDDVADAAPSESDTSAVLVRSQGGRNFVVLVTAT